MPSNVRKFFWLNCISLGLGVIIAILMNPQLALASGAQGGWAFVLGIQVFVFLLILLLIWLIAYRRQNWARWAYVAMFIIGLPGYLAALQNLLGLTLQGGMSLLQVCLQVASLYFIFTGDAVAWFKRTAEPAP